jgi:hypothetical protein
MVQDLRKCVKVFGFYSECGRKASEGFESDVI